MTMEATPRSRETALEVAEDLVVEMIGKFDSGCRMRTARFLQEICERAGVSMSTARRVMRATTEPLRVGNRYYRVPQLPVRGVSYFIYP